MGFAVGLMTAIVLLRITSTFWMLGDDVAGIQTHPSTTAGPHDIVET